MPQWNPSSLVCVGGGAQDSKSLAKSLSTVNASLLCMVRPRMVNGGEHLEAQMVIDGEQFFIFNYFLPNMSRV